MGTSTSSSLTMPLQKFNNDPLLDGDYVKHVNVRHQVLSSLSAYKPYEEGIVYQNKIWISPCISMDFEQFIKPATYVRHLHCNRDETFSHTLQSSFKWLSNVKQDDTKWIEFIYMTLGLKDEFLCRHKPKILEEFTRIC